MCPRNPGRFALPAFVALVAAVPALSQVPRPDWRRIGNAALDLSLASPAGGPVERVWYSEDGSRLYVRASADWTFVTEDFESWTLVTSSSGATPIAPKDVAVERRPEPGARVRAQNTNLARLFAVARYVHRSDDGGRSWVSLTNFRGSSILGEGLQDLAISPRDSDELVVAGATGVWRSLDGGDSWSGLNDAIPNLAVRRLLATPRDGHGVRAAIQVGNELRAFEWMPGEKVAWQPATDASWEREQSVRQTVAQRLGPEITAIASSGEYLYAGSADGRLWTSTDRGRTWTPNQDSFDAPIEAIYADPRDSRLALAVLGARLSDVPQTRQTPHVLRTTNGGRYWDDVSSNLPDAAVHGVAVERSSGAVYVATDRGVYLSFQDLAGGAPGAPWSQLASPVSDSRALDVRLDPSAHQLYVALEGFGVYAAPAPHRFRAPRAVSAADLTERAAAPGALITIFGANVRTAKAGDLTSPVLAASDSKSEIQVPFEARGTSLQLALESATGPLSLGVPLQSAAPGVFVDSEGAAMLLDADSGVLLDARRPARSNMRVQILATGLGQVRPQWPTGMAAPIENPPAVIAPVRVLLDRMPLEVTSATLAPGYIGFYLVEVTIPKLVNFGPAELFLEVDGQPSNRVRVYIEP